ncbi:MAG: exodeoxyribonuclease V subunit alpha, partial [Azoarcus sp.]|nr:exodeoxyribonuclease V subunit alpha [Azoarcus sp.]
MKEAEAPPPTDENRRPETRDPPQTARDALAEGLATRIGRWAGEMGAAQADIAPLMRAARELALAACDGHVCLPLAALSGPQAQDTRRALLAAGLAVEAGARELSAKAWPLVIDGERLYLRHYFELETHLATALATLAAAAPPAAAAPSPARLRAVLDARFPPRPAKDADWQKVAAALALTRRLTIVSGGPGTGKTTTVAALIACLLECEPDLRIALAAPTGKAAARLREALAARARELPEAVRAKLPAQAHTIHRLLGATPTQGRFRHHAANPLALDLLVVDEASMLDIALAVALLDALPAHARLVLLGDKDQLAAVEAGAVFADLSAGWLFGAAQAARIAALTDVPAQALRHGSNQTRAALPDCVVWLRESHRFRADSGIGRLARDINAGEGAAALGWLRAGDGGDAVIWIEEDDDARTNASTAARGPSAAALAAMENGYAAYIDALRAKPEGEPPSARAARVFAAFERFRVLVAVHDSPHGRAEIDAHLAAHIRAALGVDLAAGPFWAGRPLIMLKNDPVTRLFNGDIGLCLPDAEGAARVYFPTADGSYRALPPQRL